MKKVSSILVSLVVMMAMLPMTVFAAEEQSKPNVIIDKGTGYISIFSQGNITLIVIVALIAIAAIIVLLARKKK